MEIHTMIYVFFSFSNIGLAMKLIDLQKTAQGRIEELKAKL